MNDYLSFYTIISFAYLIGGIVIGYHYHGWKSRNLKKGIGRWD